MPTPAKSNPAPGFAGRPATVETAFWCWVIAAVITAAQGLWIVTQPVPLFFLIAGGIVIVVGLAQGFLAGRVRRGHKRFADAGTALALVSVVIFALLLLTGGGGVITIAVIMALLITGAVMSQRPASQAWFDRQGAA